MEARRWRSPTLVTRDGLDRPGAEEPLELGEQILGSGLIHGSTPSCSNGARRRAPRYGRTAGGSSSQGRYRRLLAGWPTPPDDEGDVTG